MPQAVSLFRPLSLKQFFYFVDIRECLGLRALIYRRDILVFLVPRRHNIVCQITPREEVSYIVFLAGKISSSISADSSSRVDFPISVLS